MLARTEPACFVIADITGYSDSLHWGPDDPSEVEGTDEQKLAAFRHTERKVVSRLRPFIEVALRAAGRTARLSLAR